MKQRQLGPYVLLHKLAEDTLAQTYRAGLKSGDDVERVVLLCLFQASGEIGWISDTASVGHRALQGLDSPHLADLVESGELEGQAFLAYDYVPGITLSGLMRESRKNHIPVPLGLALLIVNRSAEGLMAAWQHESQDAPRLPGSSAGSGLERGRGTGPRLRGREPACADSSPMTQFKFGAGRLSRTRGGAGGPAGHHGRRLLTRRDALRADHRSRATPTDARTSWKRPSKPPRPALTVSPCPTRCATSWRRAWRRHRSGSPSRTGPRRCARSSSRAATKRAASTWPSS